MALEAVKGERPELADEYGVHPTLIPPVEEGVAGRRCGDLRAVRQEGS